MNLVLFFRERRGCFQSKRVSCAENRATICEVACKDQPATDQPTNNTANGLNPHLKYVCGLCLKVCKFHFQVYEIFGWILSVDKPPNAYECCVESTHAVATWLNFPSNQTPKHAMCCTHLTQNIFIPLCVLPSMKADRPL